MSERGRSRVVAACFFLTGATGLVYQMVWTRTLTLSFGAAQHSIATVVAAYMLGLGLGSYLLGRRADTLARPARLYAALEIAIAAYALLSPLVLGATEQAFVLVVRRLEPGPAASTGLRLVLTLAALALPTILMGGTLPLLGRALVTAGGDDAGRAFGRLYALNTLGAVAGTLLAGFVLIERLGLWRSLVLGAAINLLVGLAVLAVLPGAAPAAPLPRKVPLAELVAGRTARFALAAAFLSGFAALADELVWTRILGLLVGSSTYAFAIILGGFLLGIGAGSWFSARRPAADPALRVAAAQVLAALGAVSLLLLLAPATRLVFLAGQNPLAGSLELLGFRSLLAVVAVVPAAFGFGATFPALVALAAPDPRRAGAHVGLLYAVNTVGAILGSIAGGFVLLHFFSSYAVLRAGVITSLAIAALAVLLGREPMTRVRLAVAGAATLALVLVLRIDPWPARLLDVGAPLYARRPLPSRVELEQLFAGPDPVVFMREGPVSSVTVRDTGYARFLRVNGKTDASSAADMPTQLMSGLLPAAAHRDPRDVLIIGAGSGVTAATVATQPGVAAIDLVEIEPAVIAAGKHFADVNHDVYRDPRVRVLLADGRNHLLTSERRYDLIISEPSNPWMAGVSNLFTREFYALVDARLRGDGIFCQWVQRYGVTDRTLNRMVATLLASFPHVELWRGAGGDNLFLASRGAIVLDRVRVEGVIAAAAAGTAGAVAIHLRLHDLEDLAGYYLLGDRSLRRLVGPAPPFTDDPPQLEFEALRGLDTSDPWRATLDAEILGFKRAAGDDAPAVTPPLTPQAARYASGLAHLGLGDRAGAAQAFSQAMSLAPEPRFAQRLGDAVADRAQAEAAWRQALALDPASGAAALRLARAALDRGDRVEAARLAPLAATAEDPFETGFLAADLALAAARPADAVAALEGVARRVETAPDPLALLQRLVVPYESAAALEPGGEHAIASLAALAAAQPRLIEWRTLRADTLARIGRCADAVSEIDALAAADVRPIELLLARTHCLERLGRRDDARTALAELRRREPWRPEIGDLEDRLRAR